MMRELLVNPRVGFVALRLMLLCFECLINKVCAPGFFRELLKKTGKQRITEENRVLTLRLPIEKSLI
jgi:hypothetical protein